ncbi:MAG TPA: STAS domain-containing protein [Verrucomicrobiae bacterium]|nr:STAS domain-containing protein [Verrucomicrobiae bacterium]
MMGRFWQGGMGVALVSGKVAMHELQISKHRVHGVEVIELAGAVDALAFAEFSTGLTRMIQENTPCVILDCSRVNYIGSAQLRELLDLASQARSLGGDIKCVGLAPTIQHIANLIAMGDLLEFYDGVSDALLAFHESVADVMH